MYKLREIERNDIRIINSWRNNADLIAFLGAPYRYINPEVDEIWYENYMKNRNKEVRCAIVDENKDEIVGLVSLVSVDHLNQSSELHIMIGKEGNRGQGAGTFSIKEMLKHAFFNLNLQRVELSVLEDNLRAKNLYEKLGFQYEGRKRKARYKNGAFKDLLVYSMLREDYI